MKINKEEEWKTENGYICNATHPMQPNMTENARGRKMHLTLDKEKTLCNMKVSKILVGYGDGMYGNSTAGIDRDCKSCLQKANISIFNHPYLNYIRNNFADEYEKHI